MRIECVCFLLSTASISCGLVISDIKEEVMRCLKSVFIRVGVSRKLKKLRKNHLGQDAAKRRQPVFKFTQWPKISILPPSGKTMNWIEKWMHLLRCTLWCTLHAPRPACCSFEGVYFEQVLCRCLWVDSDAVFSFFSAGIVLSDGLESSHFCY